MKKSLEKLPLHETESAGPEGPTGKSNGGAGLLQQSLPSVPATWSFENNPSPWTAAQLTPSTIASPHGSVSPLLGQHAPAMYSSNPSMATMAYPTYPTPLVQTGMQQFPHPIQRSQTEPMMTGSVGTSYHSSSNTADPSANQSASYFPLVPQTVDNQDPSNHATGGGDLNGAHP